MCNRNDQRTLIHSISEHLKLFKSLLSWASFISVALFVSRVSRSTSFKVSGLELSISHISVFAWLFFILILSGVLRVVYRLDSAHSRLLGEHVSEATTIFETFPWLLNPFSNVVSKAHFACALSFYLFVCLALSQRAIPLEHLGPWYLVLLFPLYLLLSGLVICKIEVFSCDVGISESRSCFPYVLGGFVGVFVPFIVLFYMRGGV